MVPVLRIPIALVLGLATGATLSRTDPTFGHIILHAGQLVGGLWINALRMTVIPLVLALIVSGVAAAVAAARAGKLTSRAMLVLSRCPSPYRCSGSRIRS